MKKQFRIVTLVLVAMMLFAGMSAMAQPGHFGPGPRHHHDRISKGQVNSMIAIGTTLGVLDIASRFLAPPVVVNQTPVYTAPAYSTTTYYNTTPYYSTTKVVTTAPTQTVYYQTTPSCTSSYNFYNYAPPAPPRDYYRPAPAPRGDGFRGMPGPDGGHSQVAPMPASSHHGGPRSNWR